VLDEHEHSQYEYDNGNAVQRYDHKPVVPEFLLLPHDVPGQVTADHGKENGNDDEIYLLDAGGEIVLQSKKCSTLI
jgi:hypothetical protein